MFTKENLESKREELQNQLVRELTALENQARRVEQVKGAILAVNALIAELTAPVTKSVKKGKK